jgi:hypothetical protein
MGWTRIKRYLPLSELFRITKSFRKAYFMRQKLGSLNR